jgi:hypothetical protein
VHECTCISGHFIPTKAINLTFLLVKIAYSGVKDFVVRTTIYKIFALLLAIFPAQFSDRLITSIGIRMAIKLGLAFGCQ